MNLLSKYNLEESKPIVDNDGFTLVTGETGIDPEITREIELIRKKKKKKGVLTDFYKFQVKNKGMKNKIYLFFHQQKLLQTFYFLLKSFSFPHPPHLC